MRGFKVLVALLCAASLGSGCSGSDRSAPGTSSNPIADFKACGGDPRGDWRVESYHSDVAEAARIVSDAFGNEPACAGVLKGVHSRPEGAFTFESDGTYAYSLGVSVDIELQLTDACFSALAGVADTDADFQLTDLECQALEGSFQMQPTFSGAACGFADGACSCSISVEEAPTPGQGSYTVRDRELILSGDAWNFCARGGRLELMRDGVDGPELLVMVRP